jgi:hypothetical protein
MDDGGMITRNPGGKPGPIAKVIKTRNLMRQQQGMAPAQLKLKALNDNPYDNNSLWCKQIPFITIPSNNEQACHLPG